MENKSLEQRVQKLEREVERIRAVTECSRLVNRFCYLNNQHVQKKQAPVSTLFAMSRPDVRVQWGQVGIFAGPESVNRIYGPRGTSKEAETGGTPPPPGPDSRIGHLFLHPLASQYIEVAGDLQTAKGVWLSIGIESASDPKTGRLLPAWGWGAYGVDFIKANGDWKIWHFHIYRIFRAPYHDSWIAFDPDNELPGPAMFKADKPPIDDYPYRPNQSFVFKPDPPEPYETFDEKTAYC